MLGDEWAHLTLCHTGRKSKKKKEKGKGVGFLFCHSVSFNLGYLFSCITPLMETGRYWKQFTSKRTVSIKGQLRLRLHVLHADAKCNEKLEIVASETTTSAVEHCI